MPSIQQQFQKVLDRVFNTTNGPEDAYDSVWFDWIFIQQRDSTTEEVIGKPYLFLYLNSGSEGVGYYSQQIPYTKNNGIISIYIDFLQTETFQFQFQESEVYTEFSYVHSNDQIDTFPELYNTWEEFWNDIENEQDLDLKRTFIELINSSIQPIGPYVRKNGKNVFIIPNRPINAPKISTFYQPQWKR